MSGISEEARAELLREAQREIPLEAQPFKTLGERVGLSEQETIDAMSAMSEDGRLREISAFRSLLRRVSERGGTLLLYVAEESLEEDGRPDPDHDLPVDGCIAIGDVEDLALTVGAPLLARVERAVSGARVVCRPSEVDCCLSGAHRVERRVARGNGDRHGF